MNTEERPEDDDEEAVDKYLNVELIMNTGTNDERHGRVIKRSRGHWAANLMKLPVLQRIAHFFVFYRNELHCDCWMC
jgi:hypothetical protein